MFRKRSRAVDRVTEFAPETSQTDDRTRSSRFRLDATEAIFFSDFEIASGRCPRDGPPRSVLSESIKKPVSADRRSHLLKSSNARSC